ncbi:hypothetical protein [Pantoea sp. At-9b]|uniref:hypothetical protein n=1 Tax=Pantoea sp. (strain At-9b) TaxID=592316 RepID=UPI0001B4010E|nr:hypothetical protein [Pantoea sp. At-9b]ADU72145.1 hypothetical protein Pat9b_4825 [Pantoea sp. At-9b]
MKNSHDEKMTEVIIGEAVSELLSVGLDISWVALLDKLRTALNGETDEDRIRAVLRAIDEVRREMQVNSGGHKTSYGRSSDPFAPRGKLH